MTALTQNYLEARYKLTCSSKEENIKEALFSEYPHVWASRVGMGSKVKKWEFYIKFIPMDRCNFCVCLLFCQFWVCL